MAFLYKHVCGETGRLICTATAASLVLSSSEQEKYVGSKLLLQRSPGEP